MLGRILGATFSYWNDFWPARKARGPKKRQERNCSLKSKHHPQHPRFTRRRRFKTASAQADRCVRESEFDHLRGLVMLTPIILYTTAALMALVATACTALCLVWSVPTWRHRL